MTEINARISRRFCLVLYLVLCHFEPIGLRHLNVRALVDLESSCLLRLARAASFVEKLYCVHGVAALLGWWLDVEITGNCAEL